MGLKGLPVQPGIYDYVRTAYVEELKAVKEPFQLKAFTDRWQPLYALTKFEPIDKKAKGAKRYRISDNNVRCLIVGDYNNFEAFKCIEISRTGLCKHANQYSCPGMNIILPPVLYEADVHAEHYGVTSDIALIQSHGGYRALEE